MTVKNKADYVSTANHHKDNILNQYIRNSKIVKLLWIMCGETRSSAIIEGLHVSSMLHWRSSKQVKAAWRPLKVNN